MLNEKRIDDAINALDRCGVLFMPSDTIYGLSAKADCEPAVEKIYELKDRQKTKPLVVLASRLEQIESLGVSETITPVHKNAWSKQPTTIVLNCSDDKKHLTRRSGSLGIRLVSEPSLVAIINGVGPIVSTSANISGQPSITSVKEAQHQFGSKIDLYIDTGKIEGKPSRVIRVDGSEIENIRA